MQKILIVDDREEDLFALEKALRGPETEIIKATNGNDALTATLHHEFAVSILDVHMPDMSGFEVADYLRSDEKTRSLPIIFVTATLFDQEHTYRGYESGAVDYIVKPYNTNILKCKVNAFLELARYRKHLEDMVRERTRELESINQDLQVKALDLARSNRDLENFARIASHDLREPLHSIAITLQMIRNRIQDSLDKQSDDLIQFAVDSAKRMKMLLSELLNYSKLNRDDGFGIIETEPVLLNVLNELQPAITHAKAQVIYRSMPRVLGNAAQLRIVFRNLISNALKYRADRQLQIHIESHKQNSDWIFSVQDNGIGIDADQFDRIFMIFQQSGKKNSFESAGIGLTMVKKIVELHHGQVWVDSKIGAGSIFYFSIPDGIDKNEAQNTANTVSGR